MTSKPILRQRKQGTLQYHCFLITFFFVVLVVPGNRSFVSSFLPTVPRITTATSHPYHQDDDSQPPISITTTTTSRPLPPHHLLLLMAKRKNNKQGGDSDDLNRWYDDVDSNASPDDVFWEEMERQRLQNQLVADDTTTTTTADSSNTVYDTAPAPGTGSSIADIATGLDALSSSRNTFVGTSSSTTTASAVMDKKSAEATLQEFSAFAVQDNWLDDDLVALYNSNNAEQDAFVSEHARPLEEQLEEWEQQQNDNDRNRWSMDNDEPWDHFGEETEDDDNGGDDDDDDDKDGGGALRVEPITDSEYLFKDDDNEQDELDSESYEEDFQKRIAELSIRSNRLIKAQNNPKAMAYFSALEPNALEGYDTMWVSAIDNACFNNLQGVFRNYGIQFADNFGDWQDGRVEDGIEYSLEDIASYKARQVYKATGLPCIASRTSFEIEPVPTRTNTRTTGRPGVNENPRVLSGYRFNDIGVHVDYISEALRFFSEPTRVTRFRSCLCYFDGEVEIFDYGTADVDLHFANSMRTFIPMAQAIQEMMQKLQLTFGLEYEKWLKKRMDETMGAYGGASLKLRDRVLKEGKVLPNDIIDVSEFMDSKVDVNLMDDCAKELARRFEDLRPTKILTVATTGLVIALPMAKYLQVPVVYARKERSVVMANTLQAGYSSKTVGKNRELLVSANHIDDGERILIIDDFLSSGSSQEALLRIVADAGAEAVGVGVLLEKVYDSGRQSLSGFDVPVHSLCRVASVKGGVIQLVEEEGFNEM